MQGQAPVAVAPPTPNVVLVEEPPEADIDLTPLVSVKCKKKGCDTVFAGKTLASAVAKRGHHVRKEHN